ncbi:hypothetical protein Lal_00039839 [Lupinus albus]|nr:hypothetical protein Lal_00039839 [Lupinus albus]
MIFAIKQGILVNWPAEILKVMSWIATSSSRLLAYRIFISRIIDHMEIDTSDLEIKLTNTHDHQVDEETSVAQQEQPTAPPEAPDASQAPRMIRLGERLTGLPSSCRPCLLAQTLHLPTNLGEIEIASTSQIATSISCLCFDEDKVNLKSLKIGRINIQHDQDSDSRKSWKSRLSERSRMSEKGSPERVKSWAILEDSRLSESCNGNFGQLENFEEKRERRAFQEQRALGLILELEKRDSISRMERVVG